MLKKLLALLAIVFIVMQFIQTDVSIPEDSASKTDFLAKYEAPAEIQSLVKASCYDCHSYETKYKWYMHVAPVSWLTKGHVKDGRKHLNFSDWDSYSLKKKKHKLEECYEELDENKMPLESYLKMHDEAKLTTKERLLLVEWFKEMEHTIVD
ncbi:cytochrome C [Putridiphycobacter roseus]|uniref:Cytochrome C n=1 Tax=Putridiphycobacter roseus TaxID=2219161 RepID=A0A2W1N0M4_9FLAO|nr:heme-binding domain-containing protein [Putridiphycobacter roseus]PZE16501.1 cytochrome C [Putridiphycobacter roseus]